MWVGLADPLFLILNYSIMANPYENYQGSGDGSSFNPWQNFENSWLFHQYDNFVNGGVLYQNLAPGEAQYSEWSQQMVATMYQNWYNSAPEQMRRAMEAGINPFVAASGIAGNSSGSVAPAPNASNTSGLPNLIGSAAQGLSSFGGAFGNVASGIATLAKLRHEIKNIDQNTASEFEKMGFTHLQSIAMSTQLKYLDSKEQISVWQALASFDKTKQEYNNLLAQHRNILAQYEEIIANKDLLIAQEGESKARELVDKAMKDKIDEETRFIKADNDFWEAHHYRLGTPIYESLRDMAISDGTFNMESFGNTIASYEGQIVTATEQAKAAASWDYRPSTVTEAVSYAGSTIGSSLRDLILNNQGVKDWPSLFSKLKSNASAAREFNEAYQDAREDLYEEYLSKKRWYRRIRRGGNSQEVARSKQAMETAKANYEKLTKETFADELIKSISPR